MDPQYRPCWNNHHADIYSQGMVEPVQSKRNQESGAMDTFLKDAMLEMNAGMHSYNPNTFSQQMMLPDATANMLLNLSSKGGRGAGAGAGDANMMQASNQGIDPYPAAFLEEQTMGQQGLASDANSGLDYRLNPYTMATTAPIMTAVDPGLLATSPNEKSSASQMPSMAMAGSSGSIQTAGSQAVQRPRSKFSRSRSSRSISECVTDLNFEDPPAKKKKIQSKPAASTTAKPARPSKASSVADDEEEGKRSTVLERNRVAALKCRKKKKGFVQDLEEQCAELETTHHALQAEAQGLMSELNSMKNYLMDHASCNDPRIDNWLDSEAQRFVRETKQRAMREQGGLSSGLTYEQLIDAAAPMIPTATDSSQRARFSKSTVAKSARQSRQTSASSSQAAATIPAAQYGSATDSMDGSTWNEPPAFVPYPTGSANTSPTVAPCATMKHHPADEEE